MFFIDTKEKKQVYFCFWYKFYTRIHFINPGECGGWLYGKNTVAILDIETFHADIIDLSSEG